MVADSVDLFIAVNLPLCFQIYQLVGVIMSLASVIVCIICPVSGDARTYSLDGTLRENGSKPLGNIHDTNARDVYKILFEERTTIQIVIVKTRGFDGGEKDP